MHPDFVAALRSLKAAVEFYRHCKADIEAAAAVGALKDAVEWIEEASQKVADTMPPLPPVEY